MFLAVPIKGYNFVMAHYYLGVDIGGTKIKAALLRGLKKQKPKLFVIDTSKDRKNFLRVLERFITELLSKSDFHGKPDLRGVGVGVPGMVDPYQGVLMRAKNLPFLAGWNVKEFFGGYAKEVKVDNDSRCIVRAESAWGAAKGCKNVVGLAIGTGIGGGIIINGKMYYGSRNIAGEFGHTILHAPHSGFPVKSFEDLAGKKAFEKYGDRSEIVGVGVVNLIRSFDPDVVVLGGGGVVSGAIKLDKVRRFVRGCIKSPRARKTSVVKGKLGYAAGAIGAALLFSRQT